MLFRSAEHGVGQLKNDYLPLVRTGRELELYGHIREAFDPKRLMNPHVLSVVSATKSDRVQ